MLNVKKCSIWELFANVTLPPPDSAIAIINTIMTVLHPPPSQLLLPASPHCHSMSKLQCKHDKMNAKMSYNESILLVFKYQKIANSFFWLSFPSFFFVALFSLLFVYFIHGKLIIMFVSGKRKPLFSLKYINVMPQHSSR